MKSHGGDDVGERRPLWVTMFIALQLGIPASILYVRLYDGQRIWYGLGWDMFS